MKLIASSELMDNYKQMKLAEPEKVMQNFSDDTGRRILSIGTDGTLYLTSEQQGSAAGWQNRFRKVYAGILSGEERRGKKL